MLSEMYNYYDYYRLDIYNSILPCVLCMKVAVADCTLNEFLLAIVHVYSL
jgi:hypothetical protein